MNLLRQCLGRCALSLVLMGIVLPQTFGQESSKFSDFAKHLPSANTEVIAVNNIVGHTLTLLENDAFRRVMEQGSFAEFMSGLGSPVDLDDAVDLVEEYRSYYPETVAVSSSDELYPFTLNVFELLLRLNIVMQSLNADESFDAEIEQIEAELIKILGAFEIPDIAVWVKWEDQPTAQMLFEGLKQQVAIAGITTSLDFQSGDEEFRLQGTLEDCLERRTVLQYLELFGMVRTEEIVDAVMEIKIDVLGTYQKGGILLQVGSIDAERDQGKPDGLSLEEKVKNGASEIMFGQWNGKRVQDAAARLEESLDRWSQAKLGKLAMANDTEDMWGSFQTVVQQFNMLSDNGLLRVWREKNQVLATVRQTGLKADSTLVGAKIFDWIPEDSESYAVSNQRSMGEFLFGWMTYAEDRLATQSLKGELRGEYETVDLIDRMVAGYYEYFGEMRIHIRDELATHPAVPFAIIMDTQGKVDTLNFDFGLLNLEPISLETDKLFRFAAISRTNDTDQYVAKLKTVYEQMVAGTLESANVDLEELVLFEEIELAPGITASALNFDWLIDSEIMDFEFEGDFSPHIFVRGDFVVFATSIELSKRMIENKQSVSMPSVGSNRLLLDCGRIQGITMGNLYRSLFQVAGQILDQETRGIGEELDLVSDAIAEVSQILNHFDWRTVQENELRESQYVLDFQSK